MNSYGKAGRESPMPFDLVPFSKAKATSKSKGTFTMEQNAFSAWLSGQRSLALESWLRVLDLEKAKIFNVSATYVVSIAVH